VKSVLSLLHEYCVEHCPFSGIYLTRIHTGAVSILKNKGAKYDTMWTRKEILSRIYTLSTPSIISEKNIKVTRGEYERNLKKMKQK
jgi:hypothetical protein